MPVRVKKPRQNKILEHSVLILSEPKALVRAGQPPHGEFDLAAGQFAPDFHFAHIGGLGITGEKIPRRGPRPVARQSEGLAQIAVARLAPARHPIRHPACQIAWAHGHVAYSDTENDLLNIASPGRQSESRRGLIGAQRGVTRRARRVAGEIAVAHAGSGEDAGGIGSGATRQFGLVAVFVFGLALGAALADALGGSLRTLPHGSTEVFASGIFRSDSL